MKYSYIKAMGQEGRIKTKVNCILFCSLFSLSLRFMLRHSEVLIRTQIGKTGFFRGANSRQNGNSMHAIGIIEGEETSQ
jgi:hypothetical protein